MAMKLSRRTILVAALAPLAGLFAGCSGADNPKIAEAPAYTPPANPEPPKIPGKKEQYGSNKRYQDAMERAASR
jgi:hypothetical protein